MLRESGSQPDILEVIADLSNDEVFTPPKVANAVLDLLPDDVWSNPELRWLDPGCKTGVFPREIAKRLMVGLTEVFPAQEERLSHIMRNMVFGIAITELTALMSRRTLYCSKRADGEHSIVPMPTPAGNLWFGRVEHDYEKGRCKECGASEEQMERDNRDNYAYAFIHAAGHQQVEEEFNMKFDVIVGNPPYQMESDGGTRDVPLYHHFVDQAKALDPQYIALVVPSRWMAGGLGLSAFRKSMLADQRIAKLVDFARTEDVFPGSADFEGGVCYFLRDRGSSGRCEVTFVREGVRHGPTSRQLDEFDVFIRDSRAMPILHKVLASGGVALTEIMATNNEFGLVTNFTGYRTKQMKDGVHVHLIRKTKRVVGWMKRSDVPKGHDLIDQWKVLIPKSYGERGATPANILGPTLIAEPPSCCTQTYVSVHAGSHSEAEHIQSYLRTRFARFLLSLRKITQHASVPTYQWVPQQEWDREWTDEALYEKYGITTEEQAYIAEMIREMPA